MALHPPSGWKVFRVRSPLLPDGDNIIIVHDDGRHTSLFQSDNHVLWAFFEPYAVSMTFGELAMHFEYTVKHPEKA